MRLRQVFRIAKHELRRTNPRDMYWRMAASASRWKDLLFTKNSAFRKEVIKSYISFSFRHPEPIVGEDEIRTHAAAKWLCACQDATDDDGAALGLFPLRENNGGVWRHSYPETTGYIIQSFVQYAELYSRPELIERANRMATWESEIQMPNGGVQSGVVCAPEQQVAAVFNTGMVLQGFTYMMEVAPNEHIALAARRAADFLLDDLDPDGHFRSHGSAVSWHAIKTYNVLCAWALYRYGQITGEEKYLLAAIHSGEAAVDQQDEDGWFGNCCLDRAENPLTHTIGYTLQGLLEVGVAADRENFVRAVQKSIDALYPHVSPKGFLPGRFYKGWEPGCFSSCLTGNAQIAIVCYRLFELTNEFRYRELAARLVNFLKNFQVLESNDPTLIGCIPGSYPILASYMSGGYPNWATKYFLDALMLGSRIHD